VETLFAAERAARIDDALFPDSRIVLLAGDLA
jgi:hypothetical protein